MSHEWRQNVSSIVRETESNLARVRDKLDSSEYKHFSSGLSAHPISNEAIKYSTPTAHVPSTTSSVTRANYDTYHTTGYRGILSHNALHDDYGGSDGVSNHTPALVAMLSKKIESQNKVIEDLVRQVKLQERDREQMSNRLRSMERELVAVSRRLEESGVHLETERKMERAQQEIRMQLSELQQQVQVQRQNGTPVSVYSDDVLSTLTREVHDFKHQTREECDSLHRDMETLRTRVIKVEVDVSSQRAENKDVNRRLDRVDRTLATVSDSQHSHHKDINQSLREKHNTDRELDQLRSNMGKLMNTVDRLEHDNANTHSHPVSHLMTAGEAATHIHSTQPKTDFKSKKKLHRRVSSRTKLKPITLNSSSDEDNNYDVSTSLSLDSSSTDEESVVRLFRRNHSRLGGSNIVTPGEDVNYLLSDLDDNQQDEDEPLGIAALTGTPSVSSVELDSSDLL